MAEVVKSTNNSTLLMSDILQKLMEIALREEDAASQTLLMSAAKLMQGRALVMNELNGALAINLAIGDLRFPKVLTDSDRDNWRKLIRTAEHVS